MADSRFGQFQSCCRLCLSDKLDTLKSVFDDATADPTLQTKISSTLAIEIVPNDKLSILVCNACISTVENWRKYKKQCSLNQNKLEEWMTQTPTLADLSIQIKEEPIAVDEEEMVEQPSILEPPPEEEELPPAPVNLKKELPEEDPPILTPYLAPIKQQPEEEAPSPSIILGPDNSLDRNCRICDKLFSSHYNRKKHEKNIHGISNGKSISSAGSNSMDHDDRSQNSMNSQGSIAKIEPDTKTIFNPEQEKILFAAGLKLLKANDTPIAFEPLSKVELSYAEKCRAVVTMFATLECACHKVRHSTLKKLVAHVRAQRMWFPIFTCYACMITFNDRSVFTRHQKRCKKQTNENLIKLSNLRKRSDVKCRLYQNFKCNACRAIFSLHEDYVTHLEEIHFDLTFPYICYCDTTFNNLDSYKKHSYAVCCAQYCCDICHVVTDTLEEFLKHAEDKHDRSEGFKMLQTDKYYKTRSSLPPALHKPEPVDDIKRSHSMYHKAPTLYSELPDTKATTDSPLQGPRTSLRRRRARPQIVGETCPVCSKTYANNGNMLRHYMQVHDTTGTYATTSYAATASVVQKTEAVEDQSLYTCPDCGGMYSAVEWKKHLSGHKQQACGECGKIFQFQTELNQHRSVHLNLKVYRDSKTKSYKSTMLSPNGDANDAMHDCTVCDAMFPSQEDLEQHAQSHNELNGGREKGFSCKLCNLDFTGYVTLWDHNKQNHPNVRTPQSKDFPKECKVCGKLFYTAGSFFMHKQKHDRETKASKAKEEDEESYHTCRKCFKVFASKSNLRSHMRMHGINLSPATKSSTKGSKLPKKVWCASCHVAFDNAKALDDHRIEEHDVKQMPKLKSEVKNDNKDVLACDTCEMTFNSKSSLKRHKDKHVLEAKATMNKASVYCKYCKVPFKTVLELNRHMLVEHEELQNKLMKSIKNKNNAERNYSCPICKKVFGSANALHVHQGWHKRTKNNEQSKVLKSQKSEPVEVFQCNTCLAILPNDTALQIHILEKHRNVNAVVLIPRCATCNLDFVKQEEYDSHKKFHDFVERQRKIESAKPAVVPQTADKSPEPKRYKRTKGFPCTFCAAAFSRQDTLNSHVRQYHQDQGEYGCTQCERVFDKQNSLNIHLKVHEKYKSNNSVGSSSSMTTYSCSICNMGFNLPKDLRAHTIKSHPF